MGELDTAAEFISLYIGLAVVFAMLVLGLGKAMLWCRRNNHCKFLFPQPRIVAVRTVETAVLPPQTQCHSCQPPWTNTQGPETGYPVTPTGGYPPSRPYEPASPPIGFYVPPPPSYEQATSNDTTQHARL
ncbi:uncharacterized protein LOC124162643 [Ischnura elegans]|uniref:uncharacterized protein LOC124162643 n=1 Tax=Ischnura elegans TaxID=197161 RepID=UPI001ED872FF|nr:uncharacterized protein LOC124162643 [Ischnura elegans]